MPWAGCSILAASRDALAAIRATAAALDGVLVVDMPAAAQRDTASTTIPRRARDHSARGPGCLCRQHPRTTQPDRQTRQTASPPALKDGQISARHPAPRRAEKRAAPAGLARQCGCDSGVGCTDANKPPTGHQRLSPRRQPVRAESNTDGGSSMAGSSSPRRRRTRPSMSATMRRTVASSRPFGSSSSQSS